MSISGWKFDSDDEEKVLLANSELLMEAWLRHQASIYAKFASEERSGYLKSQVDIVANSGVVEMLSAGDDTQRAAIRLLGLCAQWVERSPESERTKMRELIGAVQLELMRRQLQSGA